MLFGLLLDSLSLFKIVFSVPILPRYLQRAREATLANFRAYIKLGVFQGGSNKVLIKDKMICGFNHLEFPGGPSRAGFFSSKRAKMQQLCFLDELLGKVILGSF